MLDERELRKAEIDLKKDLQSSEQITSLMYPSEVVADIYEEQKVYECCLWKDIRDYRF